ncbi:hypothetical protein TNCV_3283861 [Trichonephila clavipes]|nr:hypothetical protein TNCV_3283861 [Trichonephila clavipes]
MWSMVAQRLTQITPPAASPDQLWQSVEAAWSAVPQEHMQSLFESMPSRFLRTPVLADLYSMKGTCRPNFKSEDIKLQKREYLSLTPHETLATIFGCRFLQSHLLADLYSMKGTCLPNFKSINIIFKKTGIYTAGQLLRTDNTIIHSNHKMKGSKMWKIRISAGY